MSDMNDMDMNGEVEPRVCRSEAEDIQMQSNQATDEVRGRLHPQFQFVLGIFPKGKLHKACDK